LSRNGADIRHRGRLVSKLPSWILRSGTSPQHVVLTGRQEFQREVPDFRLFNVTGQFKMFNSAMIAGISAIIEPRGPDSDQMRSVILPMIGLICRKILTTFLEQNPWSEVAEKDETTRKEVQIVSLPLG